MSLLRPDQLSGVSGISDSDVLIAEINPDSASRQVVRITKDALQSSLSGQTDGTNIGDGTGLVSGNASQEIFIKSIAAGDNVQISGTSEKIIISSSGGGGESFTPFSFFSDALNNNGVISKDYYSTPTSDTYLSGIDVDSATDITLYLRWDGPPDSYMGSGFINGQQIPTGNISELGSYTRRFEGYISGLNLVGSTGITGEANGYSSVISLSEAGAGPTPLSVTISDINTATPKTGTELGTSSLKDGDYIDVYVAFDTDDVTGIKVYDSGISQGIDYASYALSGVSGVYTAKIPIEIDSNGTGPQGISVIAKNNFGTTGNSVGSNNIDIDQTYPVISASDPTGYSGRLDGLREGESTTFSNTIADWSTGTISYEALNETIYIPQSGSYEEFKTVFYNSGIYSDSDNLRIRVVRLSNGATDSKDVKIKIANGPEITGVSISSTASSATAPDIVGVSEIKGGDIIDSEVYIDGKGVAGNNIKIYVSSEGISNGTQQSYSTYSYSGLPDGSFKYSVPISVTSSTARDGFLDCAIRPRNNFDTLGDFFSGSGVAQVNNSDSPLVSIGSITYPAGQEALKDNELATIDNTGSIFDSVIYSSPNGDLTISNNTTFEASKSVARQAGNYNISTDNFKITLTNTSNGKVSSDSAVINIAHTALSLSINNLASNLSSSPGGTSDNFNLDSDQQFLGIPTLSTNPSQTSASSLTVVSSGVASTANDYRITVSDSDTKGTFAWVVSGKNLAGKATTTISSNPNYTLAGFSSRVITASPSSLGAGLASIGTYVSVLSGISFENISEGGTAPSGGTIYTYQSYADGVSLDNSYDVDNKFTVCDSAGITNSTGDYVFNLDKLNRAANSSVSNPSKFLISES